MSKGLLTDHPKLCWEWSKKNEFSPEGIGAGSGKMVWWYGFCGHEWKAIIKNRVNGAGCPYCSGNKVLKGFNDFESNHPDEAKEWSDRNLPITPDMVTCKSNKIYWWRCSKGHEWQSRVSDRSNGHGCPYCAGKILKGYNDLLTTNRDLIAEWSERNTVTPERVSSKSRQVVWWKCKKCNHEWQASIAGRVNGMQCPNCRKQGTRARYEAFLADRNYNRSKKYSLPRKSFRYYVRKSGLKCTEDDDDHIGLPFQFYFPELFIAVEFSMERANSQNRQRIEFVKNDMCLKNRIKMIRVIAPGCVQYDRCFNISRVDDSEEAISEALIVVFKALRCPMDIDVRRDRELIQKFACKIVRKERKE